MIQPGYWETTTHFTSVEVLDMPEEDRAQIQNEIANNPTTSRQCVTPAEAADPTADLVTAEHPGCEFSERTFAEGRVRIRGVCPGPNDGEIDLAWEGGFTYTTMTGAVTMEMTSAAGDMRMRGTLEARRIGDCPEGSDPEES